MRKFRFELLDRYNNLKEPVEPAESGAITHKLERQSGGLIEIRPESFELIDAYRFDGADSSVSVDVDFSNDVISINEWIRIKS